MNKLNLIDLYAKLETPTLEGEKNKLRFSACPIPSYTNHRLAKDTNNYPSILLATKGKSETRPVPIKLEHLRVLFDVDCRISQDSKLEENRFTVVSCTDQDPQIQEYFLRVSATIVTVIGQDPTHTQVAKAVGNLVELFRVMHEAPKKSVQGLWAELLLINLSNMPTELLRAWHSYPEDKYDFSSGDQRIEVKSATSKIRQHHFSLEQLSPMKGLEVLVASIFVERVGTGMSLAELSDMLRSKISDEPDLLLYLEQIVGMSLGSDWKSAAKDRFDYNLAKRSLAFYSSAIVPKITSNIPKEVSGVHFQVNLTEVPFTDKKELKAKGSIFKASVPK